jgi:hypothetical protein
MDIGSIRSGVQDARLGMFIRFIYLSLAPSEVAPFSTGWTEPSAGYLEMYLGGRETDGGNAFYTAPAFRGRAVCAGWNDPKIPQDGSVSAQPTCISGTAHPLHILLGSF